MTYPQNSLPIQNIGDNGEVPEKRIKDASDAQTLVALLIQADRERSRISAKVKGQMDGNPPYNGEKLRNAGQAYRGNINCGEAGASLSAAIVPFYDLFSGSTYYCEVRTKFGTPAEREEFSEKITEKTDQWLKDYHGFDFNVWQMLYSFVGFGKGFLMWPNKTDWRFRCIPHSRVKVPDGTDAYTENLEVLVVRESMRVDRLWGYIKDKKAAMAAGWNIDPTCQAIAAAYPKTTTGNDQYDYEFMQQRFKDRDLTEGTRVSTVQLAHVFVKEFSGKVSHLIVVEGGQATGRSGTVPTGIQQPTEYLFEDIGCYDEFYQTICPFFLETLDGSWNGATGLGHKIYSLMAIKDRLKCSAIDNAFLRTSIILQANSPSALEKTALMQVGNVTIVPDGYSVQQSTILGDVKGVIDTDIYLDNVIANNTGIYRQRQEKAQGNPITATQAENDQMNSVMLQNSTVNRFYSSLDKMYKELCRRLFMDKEFIEECKKDGIPKEALEQVKSVKAFRNVGNGSIYMRRRALAETAAMVPMLPEKGRQAWIDMNIAATLGHTVVDLLNPKPEEDKPDQQNVTAVLQVSAMKDGVPPVIIDTQNPVVFAQTFLQAATQSANSLQQGANPMEVLAFLEICGPAIHAHLERIQNDPTRKQVFEVLFQQWQKLAQLTDQLKSQIQQDQEAAAENQQKMQQQKSDQEMQFALDKQKVDADIALKAHKTQASIQEKDIKTRHGMALKDATTAQGIALKSAQAAIASQTTQKNVSKTA